MCSEKMPPFWLAYLTVERNICLDKKNFLTDIGHSFVTPIKVRKSGHSLGRFTYVTFAKVPAYEMGWECSFEVLRCACSHSFAAGWMTA